MFLSEKSTNMFRVIVLLVQNEFAKRSEHGNAAEHDLNDLASNPWHLLSDMFVLINWFNIEWTKF